MDGALQERGRKMDRDCKEKLEMEEHVPIPMRVYISRENLEAFVFTTRCPGCTPMLKGTARRAHTAACRQRVEENLEAPPRRQQRKDV